MTISQKIKQLHASLPANVKLVAVSKFHPNEAILEAYEAGQRLFGESRVQELRTKFDTLPKDIVWHFIGPLQTNKVKYIAPFIHLIESVDSLRLLKEINKQAKRNNRILPILLQVHIAEEDTKQGFSTEECYELIASGKLKEYTNISLRGLMGMATLTDDTAHVQREFHELKLLYDKCAPHTDPALFTELSMGMTNDYPFAIKEGSTLIRIGTYLFGEREY